MIKAYFITLVVCFTIVLSFGQNCNQPFAINFVDNSEESIKVRWLHSSGGNPLLGYQVAYGIKGVSVQDATKSDTVTTKNIVVADLNPSTQYEVFIRAICSADEDSGWNGPFGFTTYLSNPTQCGTSIDIQDESCNLGGQTFELNVTETGFLGFDVFVESIDLIVEHEWLADLELILENPNGAQAILTQFNGPGFDHFGINNGSCDTVTQFSSNACISIKNGQPPFLGVYKPISSLTALNDGSAAEGIWKIHVCDRSSGDKGTLKHFKLNIVPELCEPIVDFFISDVKGHSVQLNWTAPLNCQSLIVEYGEKGFPIGTGVGNTKQINCKDEKLILDELDPQVDYDYYLTNNCFTSKAPPSCIECFASNCDDESEVTTFDNLSQCTNSCAIKCPFDGPWTNASSNETDWIVWTGPTTTEQTGPDSDINRRGNYIYVESAPDVCGPLKAIILQSECISVGNDPGCGLSLYYHIEGSETGVLALQISENNGQDWTTEFGASGSEGWQRAQISLDNYINKNIIARIRATTTLGEEGDIAIDNITIHGTSSYGEKTVFWDEDKDGYGIVDSFLTICGSTPDGYADVSGDCNDKDASINPGMSEIGCNGQDENCNGLDDDNSTPPEVSIISNINETCFGLKDGTIAINTTGFNPPYEIEWNHGDQGDTIRNIGAGFYRATITDASGCATVTPFYELKSESKIQLELINKTNSTCTGRRDGSIQIKPSGGVTPYTYEWNIDQIQATILGLIEGGYQVTVTDDEGCVKVSEPYHIDVDKPLIQIQIDQTNVSCFGGSDGSLAIEIGNGVEPFQYDWDIGGNTNEIDNLKAGTYTLTVQDAIFCEAEFVYQITQPDSLEQKLLNIETLPCFGDKTGRIKTTTIGGTAPFKYLWNHGAATDDISGLGSGKYALQVTDANDCIATLDTIELIEPKELLLSVDSISTASCRRRQDGAIYLHLEGGTSPYDYFWRRAESDTLIASNIFAGNYGFTAVDQNGCKKSIPGIDVSFTNQSTSTSILQLKDNLCPEDSVAIIAVQALEGALPINYNWSNGHVLNRHTLSDTIRNLPSGQYKVTITDAEGCVSTSQIQEISNIVNFGHQVTTLQTNICKGDSNGVIGITVTGGTEDYDYLWSNGATTPAIGKLPNGWYDVSVMDQNNCAYEINNILIFSESNLTLVIDKTNTTDGLNNGTIDIHPSQGIAPINIQWDPDSLSGFNIEDLAIGIYNATVTDSLGCLIDSTIVIDKSSSIIDKNDRVNIFPNPTSEMLFIENWTGEQEAIFVNSLGEIAAKKQIREGGIDVNNMPSGYYILLLNNDTKTSEIPVIIQRY